MLRVYIICNSIAISDKGMSLSVPTSSSPKPSSKSMKLSLLLWGGVRVSCGPGPGPGTVEGRVLWMDVPSASFLPMGSTCLPVRGLPVEEEGLCEEELEEGNGGAMEASAALDERSEEVRLSTEDLVWFSFDVDVAVDAAVGGGDVSGGDIVVAGVFDSFIDVSSWM